MPSDAYETAFVRGFCESLAKRVGELESEMHFVRNGINDPVAEKAELEDRVSEMEDRVPAPEIRTRPSNLPQTEYAAESVDVAQLAKAVEGMRPITVISTDEYARLLKIEKAARKLLDAAIGETYFHGSGFHLSALRKALEGEVAACRR